jgi:hypothetical protein
MNSAGDAGAAYVLMLIGVGPVPVVVRLSVIVLFWVVRTTEDWS